MNIIKDQIKNIVGDDLDKKSRKRKHFSVPCLENRQKSLIPLRSVITFYFSLIFIEQF